MKGRMALEGKREGKIFAAVWGQAALPVPGHSKWNWKGRARCPQRAGEKAKMKFLAAV